jgi:hypothetical protein
MANIFKRTPRQEIIPGDGRAIAVRGFTFIGGLYFFLYFIAPEPLIEWSGVKSAHESISNGFIAVGTAALGLGVINILLAHGSRLVFVKAGWQFSLALLIGMFGMIAVTLAQWINTAHTSRDISRLQMVGDFATRILEDATILADLPNSKRGASLSYSPSAEFPSLNFRVDRLRSFSKEVLAEKIAELAKVDSTTNPGLLQLHGEFTVGARELEQRLNLLGYISWDSLSPNGESLLKDVATNSAKLSSTYAIIKRLIVDSSLISRWYDLLYSGLFNHLGSSMFALLGVYIAQAAYRAFRVQSFESALLMLAAVVVMLGQISFGKVLYHDMPAIRQWLLEVPNSAAFRAIRLGAGVAGLMLAIRMWLTIESRGVGRGKR